MRAVFRARAAAPAYIREDFRLSGTVHLHLARARAAAHAEVFERSSKACIFMPFEMVQRDEHVRIHDRASDLRLCHIFAPHRNDRLIRSFESVGDDHMTAR